MGRGAVRRSVSSDYATVSALTRCFSLRPAGLILRRIDPILREDRLGLTITQPLESNGENGDAALQ